MVISAHEHSEKSKSECFGVVALWLHCCSLFVLFAAFSCDDDDAAATATATEAAGENLPRLR